jgi:hypothetical protein
MNEASMRVIRACVLADVPLMMWGDPGIGKTSQITAMFDRPGDVTRVVTGNVRMPEDFAGLPRITDHGVVLEPPRWAVELNAATGLGVLVLDELTTSTPAVQAAMLRIVTERHVGDLRLAAHVRVIAIGNPPAQGGWNLSAPLANRFCHLDCGVEVDGWLTGLIAGWRTEPPMLDRERVNAAAVQQVAGYVAARRVVLAPGVPKSPVDAGRAWPSPRSWHMLARLLPYCESLEDRLLVSAGCVGASYAHEFLAWCEHSDLPDPRTVIADPSIVAWQGERADRVFAILAGVVAVAVEDSEGWSGAWRVLAHVAAVAHVDVAAAAATRLISVEHAEPVPPAALLRFADLIHNTR